MKPGLVKENTTYIKTDMKLVFGEILKKMSLKQFSDKPSHW
jgi:hypothetical protein